MNSLPNETKMHWASFKEIVYRLLRVLKGDGNFLVQDLMYASILQVYSISMSALCNPYLPLHPGVVLVPFLCYVQQMAI